MAIRKNADGSVTVGIIKDKVESVKTDSTKSEKPKKAKSK